MKINYRFAFKDGTRKVFEVNLDAENLNVIPSDDQARPEWAKIEYCRCTHCEFDEAGRQYCPIALNISDAVNSLEGYYSYDEVDVRVTTEDRSYGKITSFQQALGSLLGIYMAASGCPSMKKLKPMVRFHLPFATVEETVFRTTGAYLLAQYFLKKQGRQADLDLADLVTFYRGIQTVNQGMARRLRGVGGKDAVSNALICLDMYAKQLPYAVEDSLEELEGLFSVFWE
jgi:hypothetical protein